MSALRAAFGIHCPAQLADLPNYDQHHPLAGAIAGHGGLVASRK
jgi:hypothetical protein